MQFCFIWLVLFLFSSVWNFAQVELFAYCLIWWLFLDHVPEFVRLVFLIIYLICICICFQPLPDTVALCINSCRIKWLAVCTSLAARSIIKGYDVLFMSQGGCRIGVCQVFITQAYTYSKWETASYSNNSFLCWCQCVCQYLKVQEKFMVTGGEEKTNKNKNPVPDSYSYLTDNDFATSSFYSSVLHFTKKKQKNNCFSYFPSSFSAALGCLSHHLISKQ